MKIGIMSDTHDHSEGLLKAIEKFNELNVDIVFHCGDWIAPSMLKHCKGLNCEIISVFGNNDGDPLGLIGNSGDKITFENHCVEREIDGKKIAMYHGTSKALLLSLLHCEKYDVVFSGHTHVGLVKKVNDTLHINPGSPSFPRAHTSSVAIYDTQTNEAELIPLGQESML